MEVYDDATPCVQRLVLDGFVRRGERPDRAAHSTSSTNDVQLFGDAEHAAACSNKLEDMGRQRR